MQIAACLFVLAAVGGVMMVGIRASGAPRPPTWLALGHGGIAAAGLVALLYAAMTQTLPAIALVAFGCFVLAAAGGATIFFFFHLREKPLPFPLMLGHGALAVTAIVLLLIGIYG